MTKLWLGLDVGTTAVKAAAYTPEGRQVAVADAPSPVIQRPDGGREQDMAQVWETVCDVLRALTEQCHGQRFEALGVAAQGDGIWCVTADGQPAGPAMLWNDTRAAEDLGDLVARGAPDAIGRGCHTSLWSGTSGMLWRWIRTHQPEMAERTGHVVTCADWVGLNLTGQIATDHSNATIPFLDLRSRTYSADQLAALDCTDLDCRLARPRNADTVLGTITSSAADLTGLPEGLPVSVGTLDLGAMIVGMGLRQPGEPMMIMGTTAVVNILTDRVAPTEAPVGASVLHPTSDAIIRVLAPTTGAAAFDWFAGLHPQSLGGGASENIAVRMNALVSAVPPGANGVTFLPYLSGERAPFVAPDIRASFHGLSATTTTGEMARAVMEGAAFSLRHCLDAEGARDTTPLQLTGGGARNDVWCQIIADIVGRRVLVSAAADHGIWGAATLGAAAAGRGDAVALAARREEALATYDPKDHGRYQPAYARYVLISDHQRALQPALSSSPRDHP